MDYIYVGGLGTTTPGRVPILICPPAGHNDKGGLVLFANHSVEWVLKPELEVLIDSIMDPTNKYTVVVSKRVTEQSGGRYKGRSAE
jgi:hypothetical protein